MKGGMYQKPIYGRNKKTISNTSYKVANLDID